MNTRIVGTIALSLGTLIYAGCAAKQRGDGGTKPAQTGPKQGSQAQGGTQGGTQGADYSRPVVASSLREQAIATIEELARATDPVVRANAVEAAGRSPARLRSVIERGLTDPNTGVRAVSAMTVGKGKIKDLAERTRSLLDDSSVFVRISAIFALAVNNRPVDQTPLADTLLTDGSIAARSQAAFVLGELRNTTSKPLLRQAMRETPANATPEQAKIFQLQVAEALIKLGDDEQRTGVRAALYPSRPEELEAAALAAQILGQVNDRKSIDQLVYLSEHKDQMGNMHPAEVRLAVAASLMAMGLKGGQFIPDQYAGSAEGPVRAQVAHAYGMMGGNYGLNRLAEMMGDPEAMVRVAAADGILRALDK